VSIPVQTQTEPDGTLTYLLPTQDVIVRVLAHRRNGTKKCPVELFHQADLVLATDCDLRQLRDVETLYKHANTLRNGPAWHEILTTVAAELPEHALTPWTAVTKTLADYEVEQKRYLWYPWIARREPFSIEGDPNVGKTALLIKLIAHITSGASFPTLFPERPERPHFPETVLLFTYEDDPSTTLHPRLLLNGGDPSRVEIIEGKRDPATGDVCPMTLQDIPQLADLLALHHPALVCFDPMQSFLGPGVDMNKATETRPILDAIRNLCRAHDCTPCYVRHNGKTQRNKSIHAALGSIDITGNMRSSLVLFADPDEKQCRVLAHGKKNGRPAPSLNVRLEGATVDVQTATGVLTVEEVEVRWDGINEMSAEDLNARENTHGGDTEEATSALMDAREFLRTVLQDGPMRVDEILTTAKRAGVSVKTLRRAKDKEGVKADRAAEPDVPKNKWPWEWYYPPTLKTPF
jgi:hypothetical protein